MNGKTERWKGAIFLYLRNKPSRGKAVDRVRRVEYRSGSWIGRMKDECMVRQRDREKQSLPYPKIQRRIEKLLYRRDEERVKYRSCCWIK